MIEYFKLALSKYAQFTGRSRRSEYWYFYLGTVIIAFAVQLLGSILGLETIFAIIAMLVNLGFLVPSLAVGVRRLHDVGRSGWWLLLVFTIIGAFVILYWLCVDSEEGANKYGPNPKTGAMDNDVLRHLVP